MIQMKLYVLILRIIQLQAALIISLYIWMPLFKRQMRTLYPTNFTIGKIYVKITW